MHYGCWRGNTKIQSYLNHINIIGTIYEFSRVGYYSLIIGAYSTANPPLSNYYYYYYYYYLRRGVEVGDHRIRAEFSVNSCGYTTTTIWL